MIVSFRIPEQSNTNFEVETETILYVPVLSVLKRETVIYYKLDPSVEDFTDGDEVFTVLVLNYRKEGKSALFCEFQTNDPLNHFEVIIENFIILDNFPSP